MAHGSTSAGSASPSLSIFTAQPIGARLHGRHRASEGGMNHGEPGNHRHHRLDRHAGSGARCGAPHRCGGRASRGRRSPGLCRRRAVACRVAAAPARHAAGDQAPRAGVHLNPRQGAQPYYSNVHTDVQKLIGHGLVDKAPDGRVSVPWADVVVRLDASVSNAG